MAFVSRSERQLGKGIEATSKNVGPGTYIGQDLSNTKKKIST